MQEQMAQEVRHEVLGEESITANDVSKPRGRHKRQKGNGEDHSMSAIKHPPLSERAKHLKEDSNENMPKTRVRRKRGLKVDTKKGAGAKSAMNVKASEIVQLMIQTLPYLYKSYGQEYPDPVTRQLFESEQAFTDSLEQLSVYFGKERSVLFQAYIGLLLNPESNVVEVMGVLNKYANKYL